MSHVNVKQPYDCHSADMRIPLETSFGEKFGICIKQARMKNQKILVIELYQMQTGLTGFRLQMTLIRKVHDNSICCLNTMLFPDLICIYNGLWCEIDILQMTFRIIRAYYSTLQPIC